MHRLLRRQLVRHFGGDAWPPEIEELLGAVSQAYEQADLDRSMIERSLELVSDELLAKNRELEKSLGRADARARYGEQRLQSLMDTLAEGLVVYDRQARIVDINDEAAGYFGVSRQFAIGRRAVGGAIGVTFLREDGSEPTFEELPTVRAFMDGTASRNRIVGIRRRDGSEIYVRANSAPMREDGVVTHVVASYTDATAQLEVERMKTEFVALASHELRTPLTGIMGFAQLLAAREDIPEEAAAWAGLIEVEAVRLSRLTTDLLDIARIDAGGVKMKREPVSIDAAVQAVRAQLEPTARSHDFIVRGPPDTFALGDPDRISQVLFNLMENAVKYSPDGGTVGVRWGRAGSFVAIEVSDQGIGIAPSDVPHLFERFYRVEAPAYRHIRGTGMGLYLVHELVTSMHGRVEVRSELGRGSTFIVCFPPAEGASDQASSSTAA